MTGASAFAQVWRGTGVAIARSRMLRITESSGTAAKRKLTLEGRLIGPWVDELQRVTFGAGNVGDVCLDLRDLSFADPAGIDLLRRLRAAGAELGWCSEFLTLLIGGDDGAK